MCAGTRSDDEERRTERGGQKQKGKWNAEAERGGGQGRNQGGRRAEGAEGELARGDGAADGVNEG